MIEQKRCQQAATAPACLELPVALLFTPEQVDSIRAAGAAYGRLFELRATASEWPAAYAKWRTQAEAVAAVVLRKLEALEPNLYTLPEDCQMDAVTATENAMSPDGKVRASAITPATEAVLNPNGRIRACTTPRATEAVLNPNGRVRASTIAPATDIARSRDGKVRASDVQASATKQRTLPRNYYVAELLAVAPEPLPLADAEALADALRIGSDEIGACPMRGSNGDRCWGVFRLHMIVRNQARAEAAAMWLANELGDLLRACVLTDWVAPASVSPIRSSAWTTPAEGGAA